jgi:hypothetical protein
LHIAAEHRKSREQIKTGAFSQHHGFHQLSSTSTADESHRKVWKDKKGAVIGIYNSLGLRGHACEGVYVYMDVLIKVQ